MPVVVHQALLIAAKDTRIFLKDRFAVGFSFLFPFLFVIGFTLALGDQGPVDEPLVITVATQEREGISPQLLFALREESPDSINILPYYEARAAVDRGDITGFVAFPADFTRNLQQGGSTVLEVVDGGGSAESAAVLQSFATSIARDLSITQNAFDTITLLSQTGLVDTKDVDPRPLRAHPTSVIKVEVETVGEIRPFKASNFTLPGYLTMFVFFAAALSAEAIARERQTNTLERLVSNGARRGSIILGKFVGTSYRGVAQLVVMWTVGILAFGIDLGVSPIAVVVISVLMALASAAFGVLLASLVSNVQAAATSGVLVSLVLAPLGGCWWPLFITPQWMQSLAKVTPHGWANTGFNKLMLFGADFGDVTEEMIALGVFGAVFLAVALWRFRLSAE